MEKTLDVGGEQSQHAPASRASLSSEGASVLSLPIGPHQKCASFGLSDADGREYRWKFYREPYGWRFVSHDGCDRYAGETWMGAVPKFHLVAENYGLAARVS